MLYRFFFFFFFFFVNILFRKLYIDILYKSIMNILDIIYKYIYINIFI